MIIWEGMMEDKLLARIEKIEKEYAFLLEQIDKHNKETEMANLTLAKDRLETKETAAARFKAHMDWLDRIEKCDLAHNVQLTRIADALEGKTCKNCCKSAGEILGDK
jgi:hypothetical protein